MHIKYIDIFEGAPRFSQMMGEHPDLAVWNLKSFTPTPSNDFWTVPFVYKISQVFSLIIELSVMVLYDISNPLQIKSPLPLPTQII